MNHRFSINDVRSCILLRIEDKSIYTWIVKWNVEPKDIIYIRDKKTYRCTISEKNGIYIDVTFVHKTAHLYQKNKNKLNLNSGIAFGIPSD